MRCFQCKQDPEVLSLDFLLTSIEGKNIFGRFLGKRIRMQFLMSRSSIMRVCDLSPPLLKGLNFN